MHSIQYHDLGTAAAVAGGAPVTLDIDGHSVTVPAGTSVMRAAALAGVAVPKLCATDTLKAFGSCRLCLVEIEGQKGLPASCTTLVAPGMKVTHAIAAPARHPQGHRRAVRLGTPARLRHLPGEPPLRAAGRGRGPGRHRLAVCRIRPAAAARCDGACGRAALRQRPRCVQPLLRLQPGAVHRLLALRARLQRHPGHLRADRRRPRPRLAHRRQPGAAVHGIRVRLLRRSASRAARPARCWKSHARPSASPRARRPRPAPTAASAAASTSRCAARRSCAWCRTVTAARTTAMPA